MVILPIAKQRCDDSFKRTFCNRELLATLMKYCIPEYRGSPVNYIRDVCLDGALSGVQEGRQIVSGLMGLNTEDIVADAGRVYFDLLFAARLPSRPEEKVGILLNVELQNDFSPGYPITKRALYYASRMIVLQKGKCFEGSDYGGLRKVYSVWICPMVPEEYANSVVLYRMDEHRLAGKPPRHPVPEEDYDLLSMLMIHLNDKVPASTATGDNAMLRLLEAIFSRRLSETERRKVLREDFSMDISTQEEILEMKSYADCMYEEGHQEGRREGRMEGVEECILGMLNRLRTKRMSSSAILDTMVTCLGFSEDEIRRYMAQSEKETPVSPR